jgi:hypothetical protein
MSDSSPIADAVEAMVIAAVIQGMAEALGRFGGSESLAAAVVYRTEGAARKLATDVMLDCPDENLPGTKDSIAAFARDALTPAIADVVAHFVPQTNDYVH